MNADRAVRWATVLAVVAVAGVAAYVSYWHAVAVVTRLGEHDTIGHLYPVAIDGIIVAASMVLLDAARHSEDSPRLAWGLLAAGIAVTLAANVTYGVRSGPGGASWAAWPAVAFVGCYELLMLLVRASARRAGAAPVNLVETAPAPAAALTIPSPPSGDLVGPSDDLVAVPDTAEVAAEASLRATLAAGNPWSANELSQRFLLTRYHATKLRARVLAEANGQHPQETGETGNDHDRS